MNYRLLGFRLSERKSRRDIVHAVVDKVTQVCRVIYAYLLDFNIFFFVFFFFYFLHSMSFCNIVFLHKTLLCYFKSYLRFGFFLFNSLLFFWSGMCVHSINESRLM